MDNASIHKGDDVENVCKEKGFSVLYTPPYSPWFNPIETCFSCVKRLYPKMQNIQQCFESLTPSHFEAFFDNAMKTYGIDDAEAIIHKAEMTKPFVKDETHAKRAKKPPANRSKHEKKEVSVEKHPQSDGTTLIVRTVKKTLQTIETRDTKTRTDTQVMTTTTTRVAKPRKARPSKDIKRGGPLREQGKQRPDGAYNISDDNHRVGDEDHNIGDDHRVGDGHNIGDHQVGEDNQDSDNST